jgi:hypothetical protein
LRDGKLAHFLETSDGREIPIPERLVVYLDAVCQLLQTVLVIPQELLTRRIHVNLAAPSISPPCKHVGQELQGFRLKLEGTPLLPPEYRPFTCDGCPYEKTFWIVGTNATRLVGGKWQEFWDDAYGMRYEAFKTVYKATGDTSRTRRNIEQLVECVGTSSWLITNIYAEPTKREHQIDWSNILSPVPYASVDDPQSLNLYSYVRNNPTTLIDPDGHCWAVIRWWQHACNAQDGLGWRSDKQVEQAVRYARKWLRENTSFSAAQQEGLNGKQALALYKGFQNHDTSVTSDGKRWTLQFVSVLPGGVKPTSPNQMNQQVQRGQAPKSVDRVDTPRFPNEKPHVEFKDGNALNNDGTWKHGGRELTNAEEDWITQNGWNLPQ